MKCYIVLKNYNDYNMCKVTIKKIFLNKDKALEYYNRKNKQLDYLYDMYNFNETIHKEEYKERCFLIYKIIECVYFEFEEHKIEE